MIERDRITFRKWEDDFIAAAPLDMQKEMLNNNRTAPELAFPCSPAELLEFVDTAIGTHCFSVPEAFRLAVTREQNTSPGKPESKEPTILKSKALVR